MSDDLTPLEELAAQATEGPWFLCPVSTPGYMPHYGISSADCTYPNVVHAESDWEDYGRGCSLADAQFIGASRTAVPELIKAVRTLRQMCSDAAYALEMLNDGDMRITRLAQELRKQSEAGT